jgi:hypothetical protein
MARISFVNVLVIIALAGHWREVLAIPGMYEPGTRHANALVITVIVVIDAVGIVLVSVMIIIVHVTPVILAVTMNFLVTRSVIVVVPVVLYKEDSLAAANSKRCKLYLLWLTNFPCPVVNAPDLIGFTREIIPSKLRIRIGTYWYV